MAIEIAYSNEIERLLDLLSAHIVARRQSPDWSPLERTVVVVPNANVAAWLRLGIAERTGIAASLEFPYLESFFRKILTRAAPDAELLTVAALQAILMEDWRQGPWRTDGSLEAIADYLALGASSREREARLFDLSASVARCFENYALSRRDYLEGWARGRHLLQRTPDYGAMERWQAAVWRRTLGPEGLVAKLAAQRQRRLGLMADLLHETLLRPAATPAIGEAVGSGEVFVFGFSYVARVFVDFFQALAQSMDVHLFTLNPCAEPWDDLPTMGEEIREARRRGRRPGRILASSGTEEEPDAPFVGEDPFGLEAADDNVVLKLWGRPGRNYIRLINEITQCEFVGLFSDPGADTLLHRVQSGILRRESRGHHPAPPQADGTLSLLRSAGGIHREIEAIANEIWHLAAASGTGPDRLRFNDIAVVLPSGEKELYEAEISAVFQDCHAIPHRIVDATGRSRSGIVGAFSRFLEAVGRPVNRELVLELMVHPATLVRHEGDAEAWTTLARDAGIFVGADGSDLQTTYIDEDIFNWDQGLVRLALGTVVASQEGEEAPRVDVAGRPYLPLVLESSGRTSARAFVVLARSLVADLRFAAREKLTLSEWSTFFRAIILGYWSEIPGEDAAETMARQRLLGLVADLAALPAEAPVEAVTACRFLLQALQGIKDFGSDFFTDGVVVASFLPMRPLPFRVVFVVGMGEGNFPSAEVLHPLDLRGAQRRAYDVRPRDQDKYMFLETLLSVRERLYISWVAKSESDGSSIEPSGLVKELLQALRDIGMEPAEMERLQRLIPLRRFDESLFCRTGQGLLPQNLFPEAWRERAARQGWAEAPFLNAGASARKPSSPLSLGASTLQKFLSEPLNAYAKYAHRIDGEDYAEEVLVRDEPLSCDDFVRKLRLREVAVESFLAARGAGPEVVRESEARLEARLRKARAAGTIPAGFLGAMACAAERELLVPLLKRLFEVERLAPGLVPRSVSVGCPGVAGAELLPPASLDLRGNPLRLTGKVELLFAGNEALALPCFLFGADFSAAEKVSALVSLSLLLCAGVSLPPKAFLVGVRLTDADPTLDLEKDVLEVRIPSRQDAQDWIALLAEQWFETASHSYLPLKAIAFDALESEEMLFSRAYDVFQKALKDAAWRDNSPVARLARLVGPVEEYPPTTQSVRSLRQRLLPAIAFLVGKGEK